MAGRPYDFYSSFESRMVGFGSGKCGQKGMVNIDDFIFIERNQSRCYDLHIASQNDKVDFVFFQQFDLLLFPLDLIVFSKRQMVKRDVKLVGNWFQVQVVADDQWNFNIQFPGTVSSQNVIQTM